VAGGREKRKKETTIDRKREREGRKVREAKRREGKEKRGVEEGKVKVGGWQRCLAREGWCGHGT
jgi:hypothetical protein